MRGFRSGGTIAEKYGRKRMGNELTGRRIAFLVANVGVERVELTSPWQAVRDAGGEPVLLAPEKEPVQTVSHETEPGSFDPDQAVGDVLAEDFAALVLPGGVANPDKLRLVPEAIAFVQAVAAAGKADRGDLPRPVDADRGWRGGGQVAHELAQPGDRHQQAPAASGATSGSCSAPPWASTLVTSRKPDDLDAFNDELVRAFAQAT